MLAARLDISPTPAAAARVGRDGCGASNRSRECVVSFAPLGHSVSGGFFLRIGPQPAERRHDDAPTPAATVSTADRRTHGHRAGPTEAAVLELARRLTGGTQSAVGAYDGGIRCAAVSVVRRRVPESPAAEANTIEELLATLDNETACTKGQ